jgi:hypothetical protein
MPKQAASGGAALVILAILVGGCAQPAPQTESPEGVEATEEIQVATDEPTPEPTNTARPTSTPRPTATRTPRPTRTPSPTATPEPDTNTPQLAEPTTQAPTEESTEEEPTEEEPTQEPAEFVPAGTSVWVLDTAPSETGSSEACPAPFFADFYGLVAIETIDNGITWMRAQDGITYTLQRQSPNVYWGSGESIYPGYTLNISVVFTSPTSLGATFELLDQAVEGCSHYWKYGGAPR